MNRLQYIVIHCLLTPKGRWISKGDIEMWHKGPRDLPNGDVRFLGKDYLYREELPLVKINGVWISKLHGRGWDRLGYADMIHHNGEIQNLTPYNDDDFVDSNEITWGAVGVNSISRHVALEGGIHPSGSMNGMWKFEELYTDAQFVMLSAYLKQAILDYPDIKIIGHYQVPKAGKTCPNFDVPKFCKSIGIESKNIGLLT
jgi:N-acetylmuramoyl-L-alanine amidase